MSRRKLENIHPSDGVRLTQSPHGKFQNFQSIDQTNPNRGDKRLIAPDDLVRTSNTYGSGTGRYFNIYGSDYMLQAVHAKSKKAGTYRLGQHIGDIIWHHLHLAIKVKGIWRVWLDYLNRKYKLIPSNAMKPFKKWYNWNTYADRNLPNYKSNISKKPMGQKINSYQFKLAKGGWRSQVIQEIINAGIWSGTWKQNQEEFNRLNPITPTGGWRSGSIVNFADRPVAKYTHSKEMKDLLQRNQELQEEIRKAAERHKEEMKIDAEEDAKVILEMQEEIDNKHQEIIRLEEEKERIADEAQEKADAYNFKLSINPQDFKIATDFDVEEGTNRFKFTRENGEKVVKGAGIAAVGAVGTYLLQITELYDLGAIEAVVAWAIPTVFNAFREWAKTK